MPFDGNLICVVNEALEDGSVMIAVAVTDAIEDTTTTLATVATDGIAHSCSDTITAVLMAFENCETDHEAADLARALMAITGSPE